MQNRIVCTWWLGNHLFSDAKLALLFLKLLFFPPLKLCSKYGLSEKSKELVLYYSKQN